MGIILSGIGLTALQVVLERGQDEDWFDSNLIIVMTILTMITLTTVAFSTTPVPDIHSAASFYNLARRLGGNLGFAVMAILLERRTALHHANMVGTSQSRTLRFSRTKRHSRKYSFASRSTRTQRKPRR